MRVGAKSEPSAATSTAAPLATIRSLEPPRPREKVDHDKGRHDGRTHAYDNVAPKLAVSEFVHLVTSFAGIQNGKCIFRHARALQNTYPN